MMKQVGTVVGLDYSCRGSLAAPGHQHSLWHADVLRCVKLTALLHIAAFHLQWCWTTSPTSGARRAAALQRQTTCRRRAAACHDHSSS